MLLLGARTANVERDGVPSTVSAVRSSAVHAEVVNFQGNFGAPTPKRTVLYTGVGKPSSGGGREGLPGLLCYSGFVW